MIFVDQPLYTGFSYSTSDDDRCFDEKCVSNDMLDFFLALYEVRPELAGKDLFITGESYAGGRRESGSCRAWQGVEGMEMLCSAGIHHPPVSPGPCLLPRVPRCCSSCHPVSASQRSRHHHRPLRPGRRQPPLPRIQIGGGCDALSPQGPGHRQWPHQPCDPGRLVESRERGQARESLLWPGGPVAAPAIRAAVVGQII